MVKELRPALLVLVVLSVITGLIYPLAVTGIAQLTFPKQANGSLVEKDGHVVGSSLIGQNFTQPGYFWGRPSATTAADPDDATKSVAAPYNASNSAGSNLAPSAKAQADAVAERAGALKAANPDEIDPPPADLLTASASGLDPEISPTTAMWQAKRVAANRRAPLEEVRKLVAAHTKGRDLGVLGEPRVNVLELNMALDERWPLK